MASKKINLADFSTDELLEQLNETQVRLRTLKFNHVITPLENPNVLRALRKDVARIKTELRVRDIKV